MGEAPSESAYREMAERYAKLEQRRLNLACSCGSMSNDFSMHGQYCEVTEFYRSQMQQTVGAEHISDIGVYYDPWVQVRAQQAQFEEALTDDYWERLKMHYASRRW